MEFEYIDCEFVRATGKAAQVLLDVATIWIPLSVMEDEGEEIDGLREGDAVTIGVKKWFAKKEGLLE